MFSPGVMNQYAEICGWTLARAHARSGEPAQISGYLGKNDQFDEAIAAFAIAYADQSERDHASLREGGALGTGGSRDGTGLVARSLHEPSGSRAWLHARLARRGGRLGIN